MHPTPFFPDLSIEESADEENKGGRNLE